MGNLYQVDHVSNPDIGRVTMLHAGKVDVANNIVRESLVMFCLI